MEDKDILMMPVVVHEATVARFERTVKRLQGSVERIGDHFYGGAKSPP